MFGNVKFLKKLFQFHTYNIFLPETILEYTNLPDRIIKQESVENPNTSLGSHCTVSQQNRHNVVYVVHFCMFNKFLITTWNNWNF